MFEKFGEFDSVEELNLAAEELKKEGDMESIFILAAENGIDKEDAEDYIEGCVEELATTLMAAIGKIELEAKELKIDGLINDWKDYVVQCCAEDEEICKAVRKKGKRLEECMGDMLKFSFNIKRQVNKKIVDAAGLNSPIYLGIPGRAEARKIIYKYYTGQEQKK